MKLDQQLFGTTFQNPVLLASGTCGYGEELSELIELDELGGLVTKATSVEPREGNPPLRVTEYPAGMMNSVGLANVGLEAFRREKLPWLERSLRRARVFVNVVGKTAAEFVTVVRELNGVGGYVGFEINLSCPNVKEGGAMFSAREDLMTEVLAGVRAVTDKPILAKLAPNVPDIGRTAEVAEAAGADGLTLINTFPGLLFDLDSRRAALGNGTGGVSGPGILPMGVHAVWQARRRVEVPILGVGGIRTADDAMQYLLAGASLVQIGTATFADPRTALRVIAGLRSRGRSLGAGHISELIGSGRLN